MKATDYATYIAGLPRVLAAAAALFRDSRGRILVLRPNYREGWVLPGGTVESHTGETPRQAARREAAEEIGLDLAPGPLLAVDWSQSAARPPVVAYLYDGGVLSGELLARIRLQESELLSWKLIERSEVTAHLPGALGPRVLAALGALADGTGPVELENGLPAA
ncbi:NUDIX domain-containing protein [Streptomyces sp. NPDC056503]|uniref:NUDIX domain-containing protein n=1 Tax=Streptomyces sp. NPDC056503 TaxID=3345842 RepID=UPI00369679C1